LAMPGGAGREKQDWEAVIWCRVSAAAVDGGGAAMASPQRDACKRRRVAMQVDYEPGGARPGAARVLCGEVAAEVSCKAPFRACFAFAQCQGRLGAGGASSGGAGSPAAPAAAGRPSADGSFPLVLREEMLMQVVLSSNAPHPLELLSVRIVAPNNDAVSQNADCPLTLFPGDEYTACFHVCPVLVGGAGVASFGRLVAQWRRHVAQRPADARRVPPKMSSSFPIPSTLATAEALSATVRTPAFASTCEPFVAVLRTENRSGDTITATCRITDLGPFFVDGVAVKSMTLPPFSTRSLSFSLVATAVGELSLPKVAIECATAAAAPAGAGGKKIVALSKSIFVRPK